jgi:hypothetical protein
VIDNIWVALWFACHLAISSGSSKQYLHFERRSPAVGEYAYILFLESAFFQSSQEEPGHYLDGRSETIDLRVAAPSVFLRPHAQHGLLVRSLSKTAKPVLDFSSLIVGIIRIDLIAALDWLGNASTLSIHSLFPPSYYDTGYGELLNDISPDRDLGAIHHIQP